MRLHFQISGQETILDNLSNIQDNPLDIKYSPCMNRGACCPFNVLSLSSFWWKTVDLTCESTSGAAAAVDLTVAD